MSLVSNVKINASGTHVVNLDKGAAEFKPSHLAHFQLLNGSGANQANQIFTDQRTLGISANEELDLAGGLTDAFGNAITFTKIKAIIVSAAAGNGGDIQVGGSATNGFNDWVGAVGDLVAVKPGGAFAVVAPDVNGYAVTAGTGDLLKIANTDGAASGTYDITIIGVE